MCGSWNRSLLNDNETIDLGLQLAHQETVMGTSMLSKSVGFILAFESRAGGSPPVLA
jgi:hypothetical protein